MRFRSLRKHRWLTSLAVGLLTMTGVTTALVAMPLTLNQKMQLMVDQVAEFYNANYAPADWKKQQNGWDLSQQVAKAQSEISSQPDLSLHDFHYLLRNMIQSMRDYHVSIRFRWTEKATLPLVIHSAEGRYFIAYIDRAKLSTSAFPLEVGDEVTTFDGRPVGDVANELQAALGGNTPSTDQALAELQLTSRAAARGLKVPRGPVLIGGISQADKQVKESLVFWDYKPEAVTPESNLRNLNQPTSSILQSMNNRREMAAWMVPQMSLPYANDPSMVPHFDSPFDLGARKSFMPPLGAVIWSSSDDAIYHAYIYRNSAGKLIGFVRIPVYETKDYDKAINEFSELMTKMDATTDALVVDQVNNPGGSLFYGAALISHLVDRPVASPGERIKLTQDNVVEAQDFVDQFASIKDDETAQKALGGATIEGYPVTYQLARGLMNFSTAVLEDWHKGLNLSRPLAIGLDRVNPAAKGRYTKPILFVTNELDFSCGDFVPAMLQDASRGNRHVTVFGTRTAGAGGYILKVQFLNQLGIDSVSVTGSIAERAQPEKHPIENLGITPDIVYSLTADDYQNQFAGYVKAINAAVNSL